MPPSARTGLELPRSGMATAAAAAELRRERREVAMVLSLGSLGRPKRVRSSFSPWDAPGRLVGIWRPKRAVAVRASIANIVGGQSILFERMCPAIYLAWGADVLFFRLYTSK